MSPQSISVLDPFEHSLDARPTHARTAPPHSGMRPAVGLATVFAALSACTGHAPGTGAAAAAGAPADRATPARTAEVKLAALPLAFEENVGQAAAEIRYLSRNSGYGLFLTPSEAVLVLSRPENRQLPRRGGVGHETVALTNRPVPGRGGAGRETVALTIKLIGGSASPVMEAQTPLPGTVNHLIGGDPSQWRTGIKTYGAVAYRGAYPGIDLIYYGTQRQLEYDFQVEPGADPRAIGLAFTGASSVALVDGDLAIQTAAGEVRWKAPVAYQVIGGARREVASSYRLDGEAVRFELGAYDRTQPLTIDPILGYSTFLGGGLSDGGLGIAADDSGNAYMVGTSMSTNYPATAGAAHGDYDVVVSKINPSGTGLIYSTYLGGAGNDEGLAIALGNPGEVGITGLTSSTDFPVSPWATHPRLNGGSMDGFVAVLTATGGLKGATYLHGDGNNLGTGIAVWDNGSGSVGFYVTGGMASAQGSGAFVIRTGDGSDAVLLNRFGGAWEVIGRAIAAAGDDYYVVGETRGNLDLAAVTPSGFDKTYGGGSSDAFVIAIRHGNTIAFPSYATYLGGSGSDFGYSVKVDGDGNAYVFGATSSSDFPVTSGVLQGARTAEINAFVTKLNRTGSALVYSTYLGGTGHDEGYALAIDADGNAYVAGLTYSTDWPATAGAVQTVFGGGRNSDAFVARLNPHGSELLYSTLLGGGDSDWASGIAFVPPNSVYVTGAAQLGFPATPGAFQTTGHPGAGVSDAFVAKLTLPPAAPPLVPAAQLSYTTAVTTTWSTGYCATVTVSNHGSTSGSWNLALPFADTIDSLWNGQYSRTTSSLILSGPTYDPVIRPGQPHTVGYCATLANYSTGSANLTGTITVVNDWGTGWCATATIVNTGSSTAVHWTITLPMPTTGTINGFYNAQYRQDGDQLTIWGPTWQPNLAPGEATNNITMCAAR